MISLSKIKLIYVILLAFTSVSLIAQSSEIEEVEVTDSTKTLFSNVKISTLGLYIAPEAQYGQLAGAFTGFTGSSIMAIVNKKFALGATFNGNQHNFTPTSINANSALQLRYRSAGLKMEYSFTPHKIVHFSIPVTIGGGYSSVDSVNAIVQIEDHDGHRNRNRTSAGNSFAYVQPSLNLNVNIFKYGKWFLGAAYRVNVYTEENTSALVNLTNNQLSGLTFQTGIKIGLFGYDLKKFRKEQ